MKMTTMLEDQTTTDPTRIAWRTTIWTTTDQTTKEVLMSPDLETIKVRITADPETIEVWMTTDLATIKVRMTRYLETMEVFISEVDCRCSCFGFYCPGMGVFEKG